MVDLRATARAAATVITPMSAAEQMRDAAAKACEQQSRDFLDPGYAGPHPIGSFPERFACGECAAAIRDIPIPNDPVRAALVEAVKSALNMVDGDGGPPDWHALRAVITLAGETT